MQTEVQSIRLLIQGLIQGVGFRPFVFRVAQACRLNGWVQNTGEGVVVEVSGQQSRLDEFVQRIVKDKPSGAQIDAIHRTEIDPGELPTFHIRKSQSSEITTRIPLDISICADCRLELLSAANRRYQYPFITCAACGPRFTILRTLPFDRANTSMAKFVMCNACAKEYNDPDDRRFHAQTISCAACGPKLQLVEKGRDFKTVNTEAIRRAAMLLKKGAAIAVKGLGGYHIAVDASNEHAIVQLRIRKNRSEKPFAVMFANLAELKRYCKPTHEESQLLEGPLAPIVLIEIQVEQPLAGNVYFDAPRLGAMLPHTPLQLLLMEEFGGPLVMTSGNQAHGPIVIDDEVALQKLSDMVDGFLIHDRAIYHHADDSVMRMRGRETVSLRMGRGLAPSVFPCADGPSCLVALGGQQKNSFAIRNGKSLLVSQDMGNLDDWESCQRLKHEVKAYLDLLGLAPAAILCDQHPEYGSSRLARTMSLNPVEVQHHQAHVMACALEHAFSGKALALAWDGWGLANREELWGGEFFQLDCQYEDWFIQRLGSIDPFPLVGADRTAREPRRSALALGSLLFGENAEQALTIHKAAACFADRSMARSILEAIKCGLYGRQSTSVGRLFDAVASFLDLRQVCTFEGQAAILLEGCVDRSSRYRPYKVEIHRREGLYQIDWRPGILELLADRRSDRSRGEIAASFHHMLVEAVVLMIALTGDRCVLASGGVFQNCYLVECLKHQLQIRNVELLMPRLLPAHDGNLSAGQVMWALRAGKV